MPRAARRQKEDPGGIFGGFSLAQQSPAPRRKQVRDQLRLARCVLEQVQPHMTQKLILRGEVDARALRVRCACRSDRGLVVQASAVSAMRLSVGVVSVV